MENREPTPVDSQPGNALTIPLSQRGFPRWLIFIGAAVGLLYILNPTAGILELLPDNLPIVGNLDEGVAFTLIWFGINEILDARKRRKMP